MNDILLTGATGFMGSHFVHHHAKRFGRVYCLTRAQNASSAHERVRKSLDAAARSYGALVEPPPSLRAIPGDLAGVSAQLLSESGVVRGSVHEVWHFAASLNFEERDAEAIHATNVDGLRNLLRVSKELGVRRFVYMSTAYTCGQAKGDIAESLHPLSTEFNNEYERSKCAAERDVHEFCTANGMSYVILRPSIVIGPSVTCKSGGSTTGLYGFIRELRRMRALLNKTDQEVRLDADDDIHANFVPIDHVMHDIGYLLDRDFSGGPIFHLTSDATVPLRDGFQALCTKLGVTNVRMVRIEDGDHSPVEQLFARRNIFYRAYLRDAKRFVRTIPRRNGVDFEMLCAFLDEGIRDLAGASPERLFDAERATAPDGASLQFYRSRALGAKREAIVLVNAYGMPVDFMGNLALEFGEGFDIVTWESRGVPSPPMDGLGVDIAAHVADLDAVLRHAGLARAHIVGWCTGARIALEFARKFPVKVRSLSLLNGSFNLPDRKHETVYGRNLRELAADIARDPKYAQLFHRLFYSSRQTASQNGTQQDAISTVLAAVDASLMHLGNLPFRDPKNLHLYARMIDAFCGQPAQSASEIRVPTLVVTGSGDGIASESSSTAIAAELPDCRRLLRSPDLDHFALVHRAARLADAIKQLISQVQASVQLPQQESRRHPE